MSGAVLAIDTAGPSVGLALAGPAGESEWTAPGGRGADAVMVPALAEMLGQLDAPLVGVAVTVGPGAFTGLRVGLAVATGVALSRGVPMYTMGSLAARALLCPDEDEVLVLLDARKSRFYGARFRTRAELRCLRAPVDAALTALLHDLTPGAVAAGEGAEVARAELTAQGVAIAEAPACSVALALARHAHAGGLEAVDAAAVRLRYVRPPDAKVPRGLSLLKPPG